MAHSSRASRARACTHAPSSTTSARSGAYLRANSRKSPTGIVWDAARCRSIYDIRRFVNGGTITFHSDTWTWTRARWERGHMAHGAVWLRVRTLSISLWRWERITCWGLADWWNPIFRLNKCRLEDWDTYISSVSGLAHSHPHPTQAHTHPHSHSSARSTHLPASTVAGGSGQGPVH
jgi:hypothetical protein